jgi:hypothetical protein
MKRQPRTPIRRGRHLRKEKLPEMRTITNTSQVTVLRLADRFDSIFDLTDRSPNGDGRAVLEERDMEWR